MAVMTTTSTTTGHSRSRGRIVIGIDGSEASTAALRWAAAQSRLTGCALDLVSVYSPAAEVAYGFGTAGFSALSLDELDKAARELLDEARALLPADLDAAVTTATVCDASASRALTQASAGATLLVVGAHRRIGFGMLGSTAVACLKHAKTPVVVVPAPAAAPDEDVTLALLEAELQS